MGWPLLITWRRTTGARNVAVLEKGYIGSGNVGRNTTIIRSNYLMPGNIPFYEHSLKLWEGLEQDLNYNAMISQRGVLNLFHNDSQRDACVRRGNAMHLHGVDGELLNREQVRKLLPTADFDNARFPILGGLLQRRGGTVRHDAVAWGFARAADSLGVDILQNCEVTGIRQDDNGVSGVETTRGFIASRRIGHGLRRQHAAAWHRWLACACRSRATCCRHSSRKASSRSCRA